MSIDPTHRTGARSTDARSTDLRGTGARTTGAPARRAVIFDLDGVVVDSFAVMEQAFAVAYAEVVGPGPAPFDEYRRHLGRHFPDIMQIMGLPLAMEAPFVRESYRLSHQVTVFDGVLDLLTELRARGLVMAIATGKSGPRARALLHDAGLAGFFAHVIGSDEVPRPKPAPDMVEHALRLLGVPTAEAVMVGDAPTDIASARGAGVTAVAATWALSDDGDLLAAHPDLVIRSPGELLAHCPAVPA
ncbi:HAD-IA family hydrolase [Streptomyces sp. NPDC059894]|uniref:HAD-IA family hydrolase n=1 Tax=unclassified Streptomyces TaxID=2593676 RepID=UPI0036466E22